MKTAAAVAAAEEVNYNIIPPSDAAKTAVRPQPPAEDFIVRIRDAVKTYDGKHAVLNGINVSMRKGEIYGLLGPSGCGKTTLLSVIVGRTELDSGKIMVKMTKREDIGYMPQDLDLHQNLTIFQTYKFYGLMLNMNTDTILDRAAELAQMLELPSSHCVIETLSGGQQRRVSFAVALLHNPNILILDEPTVGLDPILSNSIWNHLVFFAEQGKTIIITTHYIEEARRAHNIGVMRKGVLVAEESPEVLMTRCNTVTLEEAFLALSKNQETWSNTQVITTHKISHSKESTPALDLNDGVFRKNRLYSLLYKDVCLLLQHKAFSVFLILLPLVTVYFFNLAVGHDPQGLKIAVVNKEMQQKHVKLYYNEIDAALSAVRKNHVWGLLYFPNNYTASMANRYTNGPQTSNEHVEHSTVQTWIDFSNTYIGNMMQRNVVGGMQEYLGEALSKCNISISAPISFETPVYGSVDIAFINYASAAIICLLCYFLPSLFTLGLIMSEKQEGMMRRMMVSGIKFGEVVTSTLVIQLAIHIIQTAISMIVMYKYFGNPYLGDHTPAVVLLVLLGMEGMILGFLLSALCNSFMVAAFLGAGMNIAFSLTCGLIWPLEGTHYLMKIIGPLFPLNAPVKALIMITNKGWSFGSEPVYLGIVSIFCWSCIKIAIVFITSRINKDLWISKK